MFRPSTRFYYAIKYKKTLFAQTRIYGFSTESLLEKKFK